MSAALPKREMLSAASHIARAVASRAVALRAVALRAVALRAVALRAVALRAVALRAVALRAVALRAVELRAVVLSTAELEPSTPPPHPSACPAPDLVLESSPPSSCLAIPVHCWLFRHRNSNKRVSAHPCCLAQSLC
jgi:hypothetical protein